MSELWQQLQSAQAALGETNETTTPQVQAFQQGMQTLNAMQENPDTLTENTLSAANAFIEALMYQPEWPEALMGLSYWLYLAGDSASAMHYAQRTLSQDKSREDAQDMVSTLESVTQLQSMQGNLSGSDKANEASSLLEVKRISLLLQVHHQLINTELDQAVLHDEVQIHNRQSSLETLVQMLVMQLDKGFPETEDLNTQLEIVNEDLQKLQRLKQEFLLLKAFRSQVQQYFNKLTRVVIGFRMGKNPLGESAAEALANLKGLRKTYEALKLELKNAPEHLEQQMQSLSGWEHVEQQYTQLKSIAL